MRPAADQIRGREFEPGPAPPPSGKAKLRVVK
jgi:hypothetical protein